GETRAHAELVGDVERWTNEIRSGAVDHCGGHVWIEKVKFRTHLPATHPMTKSAEGALGELMRLLDEFASGQGELPDLADELKDLAQKLPRELKEGAEGTMISDTQWLAGLLEQVRPMLIRRLLRRENSQ
ncbi:MAG: hypothetical protein JSW39_06675, partial [Desulfobacterales bacterium]